MIVRLDADGAVVADADDCSAVHVQTTLEPDGLRAALLHTGTGSLTDGGDGVVLDVAVLRSRAGLLGEPAPFDTIEGDTGNIGEIRYVITLAKWPACSG